MNRPAGKRLPITRFEYIFLSACTMMLTALGIDIMLPALAELRRHFGLDSNSGAAANIIVFFFMGQVAQLIFGILSDRFGRLPILRIGFPLYIIGGLAATFAPSLTTMCAARFIAGMGASAVLTTTIAGVRDRFVGDQMAKTMSLIFTIFLFTPILAPFIGLAILKWASWKWVFLTPPLFALVVFGWSLWRLDESHPPEQRSSLKWPAVTQAIKNVITNSSFLRFTFVTTFLFSGLSIWVSSSERIIGELYGIPEKFPWIFGGMGLVMSLTSLYNARLSVRYGARNTIRMLIWIYTGIGLLLLLLTLRNDPPDATLFFTGVVLIMAANLAIEPNSSALALESLGDNAGIAASLYGTIFFFVGSSIGALIGHLMTHSILPLSAGFFTLGVIATILVWTEKRKNVSK